MYISATNRAALIMLITFAVVVVVNSPVVELLVLLFLVGELGLGWKGVQRELQEKVTSQALAIIRAQLEQIRRLQSHPDFARASSPTERSDEHP